MLRISGNKSLFYYNHYNKLNPKRALLEVHNREIKQKCITTRNAN